MQNGLQLNENKSEVFIAGTPYQLRAAASITSVSVAGVMLPVSATLKTLGVTLDRKLTFGNHVATVVGSCNYHASAIRHIRPLLSTELAKTLTCSLILSRLDYCNSLLYGAPNTVIAKLQRAQNHAARIVTDSPRLTKSTPLLKSLHWLPVEQRICFKLALMTFKVRSTSTPVYLSCLLNVRSCPRTLRSSAVPRLDYSTPRTEFAKRAFRQAAPALWNTLPETVLCCNSVRCFKSRLKTFLFNKVFNCATQ